MNGPAKNRLHDYEAGWLADAAPEDGSGKREGTAGGPEPRRTGRDRRHERAAGETAGGAEAAAAEKRAGMMLARLLLRPLVRGRALAYFGG